MKTPLQGILYHFLLMYLFQNRELISHRQTGNLFANGRNNDTIVWGIFLSGHILDKLTSLIKST